MTRLQLSKVILVEAPQVQLSSLMDVGVDGVGGQRILLLHVLLIEVLISLTIKVVIYHLRLMNHFKVVLIMVIQSLK
jgi:hypothetical protein